MRPRIKETIVVEGRYDKITLSQYVQANILELGGFQVFKEKEKVHLLRRLAADRGIIILTDSDSAGFLIRNHLRGVLPDTGVKHAYIPDVFGKERRKAVPSKEGKLGVEGMDRETILGALRRAGATFEEEMTEEKREPALTKADLYALGLSGSPDSHARRQALLERLQLPQRLSSNALLDVLNALYSPETLRLYILDTDRSDDADQ